MAREAAKLCDDLCVYSDAGGGVILCLCLSEPSKDIHDTAITETMMFAQGVPMRHCEHQERDRDMASDRKLIHMYVVEFVAQATDDAIVDCLAFVFTDYLENKCVMEAVANVVLITDNIVTVMCVIELAATHYVPSVMAASNIDSLV